MLVIFLISLVINYYNVGGIQSSFKKESTLFSTILNKSDSELNIDDLLFGDNEEIEENITTVEENIAKNETGTNNETGSLIKMSFAGLTQSMFSELSADNENNFVFSPLRFVNIFS